MHSSTRPHNSAGRKPRPPRPQRQIRNQNLRTRYGITAKQWDDAYDLQDGNCANPRCLRKPTDVDHDHATNEFRGLLCSQCNRALGAINDDLDVLQGLIEYLNERKTRAASSQAL